jgi:hypothetical protein
MAERDYRGADDRAENEARYQLYNLLVGDAADLNPVTGAVTLTGKKLPYPEADIDDALEQALKERYDSWDKPWEEDNADDYIIDEDEEIDRFWAAIVEEGDCLDIAKRASEILTGKGKK